MGLRLTRERSGGVGTVGQLARAGRSRVTCATGAPGPRIYVGAALGLLALSCGIVWLPGQTRAADTAPPNIVGTWKGQNNTISDLKGLRTWDKTIHITEQTDRRFRGYFTYSAGTKTFFGVIYPDDTTISWVASDSRGYNQGRILGPDRLAACYIESGIDATAGCSDLTRVSKTPEPLKAAGK
ncbi:MAG: hypothetical protein AAFV45_15500 [Pseudomonadota bacterium]